MLFGGAAVCPYRPVRVALLQGLLCPIGRRGCFSQVSFQPWPVILGDGCGPRQPRRLFGVLVHPLQRSTVLLWRRLAALALRAGGVHPTTLSGCAEHVGDVTEQGKSMEPFSRPIVIPLPLAMAESYAVQFSNAAVVVQSCV